MKRIVVVGGSLAGHHAAATLRRLGYDGALTVIGSEQHRPYDRYPLSKAFLTGETDRKGLELADDIPGVDWRLGSTATDADLGARHVVVDDGERICFDGLVVASGARPRHSELARGQGDAFVMRTVEDAVALRAALASPGRRVVVVGGGLIGVEIAATAVQATTRRWYTRAVWRRSTGWVRRWPSTSAGCTGMPGCGCGHVRGSASSSASPVPRP